MAEQLYPIIVFPLQEDDGGGFVAYAPDLFGCMSDGETVEEAAANVQAAIGEWIDEITRLGREIPAPGSASKAAEEQWQNLITVIEKQEKLITEQENAYQKLQQRAEDLKARVAALRSVHKSDPHEADVAPWSTMRLVLPTHVVARTRRVRDSDHRH